MLSPETTHPPSPVLTMPPLMGPISVFVSIGASDHGPYRERQRGVHGCVGQPLADVIQEEGIRLSTAEKTSVEGGGHDEQIECGGRTTPVTVCCPAHAAGVMRLATDRDRPAGLREVVEKPPTGAILPSNTRVPASNPEPFSGLLIGAPDLVVHPKEVVGPVAQGGGIGPGVRTVGAEPELSDGRGPEIGMLLTTFSAKPSSIGDLIDCYRRRKRSFGCCQFWKADRLPWTKTSKTQSVDVPAQPPPVFK